MRECKCKLKDHAKRPEIDHQLDLGDSVRLVASTYALSKTAVHDHKTKCLQIKGEMQPRGAQRSWAYPKKPATHLEDEHPDEEPPDSSADNCPVVSEDAADIPDTMVARTGSVARTLTLHNPNYAKTGDEKVAYILDIMLSGKWRSPMLRQLAKVWEIRTLSCQGYVTRAAWWADKIRGSVAVQRAISIGKWEALYDKALAAKELKSAVAAQTGLDKATGVIASGNGKTEVNIINNPIFAEAWRTVAGALRDAGELKALEIAEHALTGMGRRNITVAAEG